MRDIALLNLTRFGDLIQTTPVLSSLRRHYPGVRIHLIIKSRFRGAADLLPAVDVIHEIDGDALAETVSKPGIPFVERFRQIRDMVDRLSGIHFDEIINLTHSRASAVLLSLLDADRVVGFTLDRNGHRRVNNPWLAHMATLIRARRLSRFNLVDIYLGAVGLIGSREPVRVCIPDPARVIAAQRLPGPGPRIGVQLGASTDTKTWSISGFAETLTDLARRIPDLRVVMVGVAAEKEPAQRLRARCPEVAFDDLVGKTEIDELAAVLERIDLLLTGDTGTMHLAAAAGTLTCGVFVGLGTPYETAAYAEGHWAVMSRIACAPCAHSVKCGHTACHGDIVPSWLADLLQRILERKPVEDIAPLPRADLLRTRFAEDGLLELVAVHRRAPEPQELLAGVYRAAFLESLEGTPVDPQRLWRQAAERFGVQPGQWQEVLPEPLPGQLERLEELARHAEETTSGIENIGDQPMALRESGKRLREIDQGIYCIARAEPLLAPLGLAHETDLEDLPDADLPTLARLSSQHYRNLHRRVAVLRLAIGATQITPSLQGGLS